MNTTSINKAEYEYEWRALYNGIQLGCAYIQVLAVISLNGRRLFQTLTNMHTPTQHYSRSISTTPFIVSCLAFPSFPIPA